MVINGDMESWTGGVPDSWSKTENISQESTNVHGGSFSAAHMSDEGTKDLSQDISGIQAGQQYTISYWYLDDDSEARTRIWAYWLSGTTTLPDNEDILRPGTYSEDNSSWLQFNEELTAPAGADGFRFEVRVYKQDGVWGGQVYYDDFELIGDNTVYPEPTNYPTNFMADAAGLSVNLTWTDAVGAELPSAYIIMAGLSPTLPVPVDGTPVANDTDLSDGNGALNVSYGEEMAAFSNLEGNTTYYFTIYSYTNSGANIDFKTDGTAPSASASTSNITIIESENFDDSWGNWSTISITGTQAWSRDNTYGIGSTPCAAMTGYEGQPYENEDWLISPALNLDDYENEVLVFYNALGYTGPDLELKISTDYDGGGDPTTATWTDESFTFSTGFFEWTESGNIDLSVYTGSAVYVAFRFTSTDAESATWEVDDIVISGEEDAVIDPEPSNYPTDFEAIASGTNIELMWIDAIGAQLPDSYIVFAGTSASLPTPEDGTPVPNDTDLSDGSGALNIAFGMEEAMFTNLAQGTTYYFSIYPYTNSGNNIDFKNDGTAPTASALIPMIPEPTNYPTDFTAEATSSQISLMWTDATGAQLPEMYIIYAGTSASLPSPTDGIPTPDDLDLSDGMGAANVEYGIEDFSFSGLEPSTTYYFAIYPYTNSGVNINYKNDGAAPTADATTTTIVELIIIEEENFDISWGDWTTVSVVGDQVWDRDNTYGINSTPCAAMTGYEGQAYENDDWLISPALDLDSYMNEILVFQNALGYTGPDLQVKISTDYDGGGDPGSATWTNESFMMSTGFFEWTESGEISLAGYDGSAVYVAFHFTSTNSESATWEVDDIVIMGEDDLSSDGNMFANDLFKVYPNPTSGLIYIEKPGMEFSNIDIISVTGKVVKSIDSSTELTQIDLTELNKGLYILTFINKETGQTITRKLILQ